MWKLRGIVTVAHVPTGYMLADVFTKPLAKIKFFRFINAILGIAQIDDSCHLADFRKGGKERQVRHFRYSSEFEEADKEVTTNKVGVRVWTKQRGEALVLYFPTPARLLTYAKRQN
jgi:hypothetical protein